MNAIIIDDEKKGREILSKLVETYCQDVNIVAMAANADEGYEAITEKKPDIVFLDIEMPNGNGFSLLERFNEINFQIIFTTAYDNYAIQAIRHHALDYLLKPIDIDELKTAVENAKNALKEKPEVNRYTEFIAERKLDSNSRLALPIKEGIAYLSVSEIIRVESDGSYSTFYSSDGKKYVVSKNIGEYETILPVKDFFRSHKSHLINIKKVKKFLRTDGYFAEMEDGSVIEISRRKKDEFLQLMSGIE
jgi:two-component system LytT family response regulator